MSLFYLSQLSRSQKMCKVVNDNIENEDFRTEIKISSISICFYRMLWFVTITTI